MKQVFEYIILTIITLFLQVFILEHLEFSTYLHPSIFLAFLILLPMDLKGVWVLLISFGLGIIMDLVSATPAIYTVSTLFAAFCRPLILLVMVGNQELHDGGVPSSRRLGFKRYFNYSFTVIFVMNFIFFMLEKLSFTMFFTTFMRALISALVSTILIYFCQLVFIKNTQK